MHGSSCTKGPWQVRGMITTADPSSAVPSHGWSEAHSDGRNDITVHPTDTVGGCGKGDVCPLSPLYRAYKRNRQSRISPPDLSLMKRPSAEGLHSVDACTRVPAKLTNGGYNKGRQKLITATTRAHNRQRTTHHAYTLDTTLQPELTPHPAIPPQLQTTTSAKLILTQQS